MYDPNIPGLYPSTATQTYGGATPPPQQPQADPSRTLNLAASDPLSFGGQFGSASGNTDYAHNFGTALQGLLKTYQGLGTTPVKYQTQALNASDAQVKASTTQLTNPALQGFSPGTIMNASSAAAQPFNPLINSANDSAQTFSGRLSDIKSQIDAAQNLVDKQQAQTDKHKADSINLVFDTANSFGSEGLASLNPELFKAAGLDQKSLVAAQKAKEATAQKQFNIIHASTSTPTPTSVSDPVAVGIQDIIAKIPPVGTGPFYRQWEQAKQAIDKQYGAGTADSAVYRPMLAAVYEQGKNAYQVELPQIQSPGNYKPIDASRYALAATRIAKNYIDLPAYQAVSQGMVYLPRIAAAAENPGSIGDAELLDSITKLNTGGNAITDAQIKLITGNKSLSDSLNVFGNKLKKGGALSDDQRAQLTKIAQVTFDKYKQTYTPIYTQATKQLKGAGIPEAFWTIPDLNKLSGNSSASANTFTGKTSSGLGYQIIH